MPRIPVPTLRAAALLLAAAAATTALAAPVAAAAAPYVKEGCRVDVPDGWVTSKTRIASPDRKMWAELMSAGSAAEVVPIETGLKAVKLSEDGRIILMQNTASYGGLTNKMFHAITKTTPSCVADVVAPAGAQEAAAKVIALTVRPAK